MVLILDGNSLHVAHAGWKIGLFGKKCPICACSRTNQKPYTGQLTVIAPYMRTYFELSSNISNMGFFVRSKLSTTLKLQLTIFFFEFLIRREVLIPVLDGVQIPVRKQIFCVLCRTAKMQYLVF